MQLMNAIRNSEGDAKAQVIVPLELESHYIICFIII